MQTSVAQGGPSLFNPASKERIGRRNDKYGVYFCSRFKKRRVAHPILSRKVNNQRDMGCAIRPCLTEPALNFLPPLLANLALNEIIDRLGVGALAICGNLKIIRVPIRNILPQDQAKTEALTLVADPVE